MPLSRTVGRYQLGLADVEPEPVLPDEDPPKLPYCSICRRRILVSSECPFCGGDTDQQSADPDTPNSFAGKEYSER